MSTWAIEGNGILQALAKGKILRIISGIAKGLELRVPSGLSVRPSSAKVRAAVMNSLQLQLEGARVLDLCAGSGALGLEALSRGSKSATFVEIQAATVKLLKQNIAAFEQRCRNQSLSMPEVRVYLQDTAAFLKNDRHTPCYDLVFADPPYKDALAMLPLILTNLPQLLVDEGYLIFECSSEDDADVRLVEITDQYLCWELVRQKKYGETLISSFCYHHE